MSEPKRFNFSATIVHHIDGKTTAAIKYHTEPDGLFVSYEDYARLKAEVDELKSQPDALTAYLYADTLRRDDIKTLKAQVERLTTLVESNLNQSKLAMAKSDASVRTLEAQVERLTKAGDAFYESEIGYYGEQIINDPKHHSGQMCRDWNAAKEGKPRA
jgi:hypothetical protein